ncbi:MAG: glycosyltransferase family 2 protein [Clostridia bacterium]|nr:glycosyltransferase family 2 protein [Clostridia bacterium]
MTYIKTIDLIINILTFALGVLSAHFILFAIVGVFRKRTYPVTDKVNRYGIIIPARNEESVVAGLIESIKKNDYPQDKLQIFVIAHNCSDKTAEVARNCGVTVYEYNNPEENTMGYAFKYLFSCIERDFGTQNYDGFFLFNADNILDRNYIARMNDAYEYYGHDSVITSYRNSKNFGTNLISGLYGMYFAIGCRFESRGRTALGCSTRVQGTGYLINSNIVKRGWPYVSLTEDWEFTADQILFENKIKYCDDAVFYDEQPTSVHIMWRQRVRWSRGHLLVFYARFRDLIASVFKRSSDHRVSLYDITVNIMPLPLVMAILQVLKVALGLLAPVFDKTVTMRDVLFGTNSGFFTSDGMLMIGLRSVILSYLVMLPMAIIIFIIERKRIIGVSFFKKILITLFWPLFLLIQLPIDVQAFFSRNLGWKPIPHNDQTSFDNVNPSTEEKEKNKIA